MEPDGSEIFDDGGSAFEDDDEETLNSRKLSRDEIKLMNVVRAIVTLLLLTIAVISAELVFVVALISEQDNFARSFEDVSYEIIKSFHDTVDNNLWVGRTLATDMSLSVDESSEWPFVTIDSFESRCDGSLRLGEATTISFSPFVLEASRAPWEIYAWSIVQENPPMGDPSENRGSDSVEYYKSPRTAAEGIYVFDAGDASDAPVDSEMLLPIWQTAPSLSNETTGLIGTLYDSLSNKVRATAVKSLFARLGAAVSTFQYQDTEHTDYAVYAEPRSTIFYPMQRIIQGDSLDLVASLEFEFMWKDLLPGVLNDDSRPVRVVVESSCGGEFTYEIIGTRTTFVGEGSVYDSKVDGYTPVSSTYEDFASLFDDHGATPVNPEQDCSFRLTVYATGQFKGYYVTNKPDVYKGIILGIGLGILAIFLAHDLLLDRQSSRVVNAAERSDAIVRSLFPSNVADRLYENAKKKEDEREANKRNKNNWKMQSTDEEGALLESPRNRMQSMKRNATDDLMMGAPKDEPIADLFPNTTVLFADIAGFTAWSSEREPQQVFRLLESIYASMDKCAKKLNVFKVETVGDCYVAATGLPDPQADHAQRMVRFAKMCLMRVSALTQELEANLGPGTAELGMRFGIHSGAVTAGVLRGRKARFQLFGDTMNTASRMESTGIKNKIQISQDTADIIIKAGNDQWMSKRQDLVPVKGKGDMQTYWVLLATLTSGSRTSSDNQSDCGLDKGAKLKSVKKSTRNLWAGTTLDGVLGITDIDDGLNRLVNWNVELLLGLLKRIVASRKSDKSPSASVLPAIENDLNTKGLVLDEMEMVIDLPGFDGDAARLAADGDIELAPEVKRELHQFVTGIASGYRRSAPFHNFEHASHVLLSCNKLLKRIVNGGDKVSHSQDSLTPEQVHESTYGIGTDPITHFAVVFSALIHDVGHTGVSNLQLVKENPLLGDKYDCKSVAEQRSVDIAWELLMFPRFKHLRSCIYQTKDEYLLFRRLVVNSVMATDIFDKELKALRNARWDAAFHGEARPETAVSKVAIDRKATIVIEHIIQASDVSHTMQHWHIYRKWNERLFKEMYFAYLDNRSEKDPSEGWYKGELWFFDNYVIPLARKLKECGVFGVSSDEYLNYALQNRNEWERKGEATTEQFKEDAMAEAALRAPPKMTNADIQEEGDDDVESNIPLDDLPVEESSDSVKVSAKPAVFNDSSESCAPAQEVVAPPGRLGIVLDVVDDSTTGAVVAEISDVSPLKDSIRKGDLIVAIDGISTASMDSAALSVLIGTNQGQHRRFMVQPSSST